MASTIRTSKTSSKKLEPINAGPGGPWHVNVPRAVREAYDSPQRDAGWAAWRKHLDRRKVPSLSRLLGVKKSSQTSPLAWALAADADVQAARELIIWLARLDLHAGDEFRLHQTVLAWQARASDPPVTASFALECLAWCDALPRLANDLPERLWWSLVNRLAAIALDPPQSPNHPLAASLLSIELPLALAANFPELAASAALAEPAGEKWTRDVLATIDQQQPGEGTFVEQLRPLVACWVRCQALYQRLDLPANERVEKRLGQVTELALRLSRPGRQGVFGTADGDAWPRDFLRAVRPLVAGRRGRQLLRLVAGKKPLDDESGRRKPFASYNNETEGVSILRPDWQPNSPQVSVAVHGSRLAFELSVASRCLWSGSWEVEVRHGKQTLAPVGDWEQTCWESDGDVDYLELSLDLEQGVHIERHVLLARKDGFLFLADGLLGKLTEGLEYRGRLPLAGYSTFAGADETREGTLQAGSQPRARVLPLALNEWRTAPAPGDLANADDNLELVQSTKHHRLFAPLFIDLDRDRLPQEITWRQLSVAQDRTLVPPQDAVGYRVQVGKSQWLIYRSLLPPTVRSVLSKNLMHEFLVGRFRPTGRVKTIVEIE